MVVNSHLRLTSQFYFPNYCQTIPKVTWQQNAFNKLLSALRLEIFHQCCFTQPLQSVAYPHGCLKFQIKKTFCLRLKLTLVEVMSTFVAPACLPLALRVEFQLMKQLDYEQSLLKTLINRDKFISLSSPLCPKNRVSFQFLCFNWKGLFLCYD